MALPFALEIEAGQHPAQRIPQDGDEVEFVFMTREGPAAVGEVAADEARVVALDEVGQDRLALAGRGDADVMGGRFRRDGVEAGGPAKGRRQPLADGGPAAFRGMEECDAPGRW